MKSALMTVCALMLLGMTAPTAAQDLSEHPLIRPYPGSELDERSSRHDRFNAHEFRVLNPDTGRPERKRVEGEFWRLVYYLHTADGERDRSVSKLEYFQNFKAAALEHAGQIEFEDSNNLVLTMPREDGGTTWAQVRVSGAGATTLVIVDEKPLETILEFGPAQMKAAMDADGTVALYGILFDYNQATLQPESNKQLQEVLTLLFAHPDLRVEIQGHTDGDGQADYNLQLSERRADSVRQYLVLFGIDPDRLTSKGYGKSMPIAPNDTAENKAKNRRVELVRLD
ncbi:hypothetical protein CKO25_15760 [Thiocapsa imhoffii]|uniref:OmpA-like domain-containing protein n=1 Tax=Thiocapsa imhoffii TaxID=382777 RepID=A0A9X0WKA0_9GAMM|nr:OmpA family protein [Thiocapsa imhoffii]MBK1646076.1 hypothetical protein [Thiocapsa imhoffii]